MKLINKVAIGKLKIASSVNEFNKQIIATNWFSSDNFQRLVGRLKPALLSTEFKFNAQRNTLPVQVWVNESILEVTQKIDLPGPVLLLSEQGAEEAAKVIAAHALRKLVEQKIEKELNGSKLHLVC